MNRKNSQVTLQHLDAIVERYDTDELILSTAYADGGTEFLRARLEAGLLNQLESGDATVSRYAIWANTVRDNILAGMDALKLDDAAEAHRHLARAANSLSAFADAQAFGPLNLGVRS